MSFPRGNILRDTTPTPVDGHPGRFSVDVGEAWRIFYAFGGMTMACALRAAEAALDRPDLRLISAEATFCQPIPVGPCAIEVEVLRSGRGGAQCHVRMWSTDDPTGLRGSDLVVTVVFGRTRPEWWSFDGVVFPGDVLDPELSRGREASDRPNPFEDIPYHHQTDFRIGTEVDPWGQEGPGEPRTFSWFRFLEAPLLDDGRWEPATLAVPGDILGPAVGVGRGRPDEFFMVLSLQISLQLLEPMTGKWLGQHTRSHHAGDGYAFGTAELWSDDRRLVGFATQSAMLRQIEAGA